jgi:hypothetical protein
LPLHDIYKRRAAISMRNINIRMPLFKGRTAVFTAEAGKVKGRRVYIRRKRLCPFMIRE